MSYVASICFSVCLYHTLLEYNILQQWIAPDVSANGQTQLILFARDMFAGSSLSVQKQVLLAMSRLIQCSA
jgi:hypothetical protein